MKNAVPTFRTDKEAEDFVGEADLSEYDLCGGQVVRFELKREDAPEPAGTMPATPDRR